MNDAIGLIETKVVAWSQPLLVVMSAASEQLLKQVPVPPLKWESY